MGNKFKTFEVDDLALALAPIHQAHSLRKANQGSTLLAKGNLLFDMFPSGIGVHCCDVIEQQQASSSVTLSPCISINILLQGKLSFSLGNCLYEFSAEQNTPLLFINVINGNEVFTRHLREQQRVIKANVTLEKSWLLERCQSTKEIEEVEQLFSLPCQVYAWSCQQNLQQYAQELISCKTTQGVTSQLQSEMLTLQLINQCLPLLLEHNSGREIKPKVVNHKRISPNSASQPDLLLESALNNMLEQEISLQQLAQKLGISVSTLQRKIKANFNLTAKEYIRNKRLEKARNELIIDGLSIGEAAYGAGYDHVANFVTAFKKHFKITPAQMRKQHQHSLG